MCGSVYLFLRGGEKERGIGNGEIVDEGVKGYVMLLDPILRLGLYREINMVR